MSGNVQLKQMYIDFTCDPGAGAGIPASQSVQHPHSIEPQLLIFQQFQETTCDGRAGVYPRYSGESKLKQTKLP